MDIVRRRSIVLILFLVFLFSTQNYFILSLGTTMNNNIICKPSERTALLSFKQHLNDLYNMSSLSSWSGENCCRWAGVVCSNTTDHVIQLQLQNRGLGGELNPSLQELKQLTHLDLSWNDFVGIRIPDFLGSLGRLRYLDLSNAGFSEMIPHQLGKLLNLRYLDLSSGYRSPKKELIVGNFQWISHLSSLQHLGLSGVNLKNASDFQWTSHLSSLKYLDLSHANLENVSNFQWISHLSSLEHLGLNNVKLTNVSDFQWISHLSSLKYLDLSYANLENVSNFQWISRLSSLEHLDLSSVNLGNAYNWFHDVVNMLPSLLVLDLSSCSLSGALPSLSHVNFTSLASLSLVDNNLNSFLPEWLYSLTNLQQLYLFWNSFQGTISPSIGRLSLLETLNLSGNKLNGSLPESLGNLSKLWMLDITKNAFEGIIVSEVQFANLTNLQYLSMDSLVLKVSPEWIPPFQLSSANLGTCQLGPGFPIWLRTQKSLTRLDLSRTGISGTIPTWFWYNVTYNFFFDLSYNELHGELPEVISAGSLKLRSNQFNGQLPRVAPNVQDLDLSNNSFSGPISTFLCNPPISEINDLRTLHLSDNLLSGNLSECWVYWTSLVSLKLGGNKITGKIPNSMGGSLLNLEQLHLSNNNLSGELPSCLRNCTSLTNIDLGGNGLTGRLPIWLGNSFPGLLILRLRSNKFYDDIPRELCHLASIRVLDIANNDLQGSIPRCFNNFSAITIKQISYFGNYSGADRDTTTIVTKGREFEYNSIIRRYITSLDLSKNSLSGEIPEELTSLIGLISLNLSDNRFTGKIPEKIGNMDSLESLDFSKNKLSGAIPQSLSSLHFLNYLNLSFNNLSGKIPLGTQLQSFNMSSYIGNQELCGPPLNKCNGDQKPPQKPDDIADEDWFEMKWFYMSMGVGFVFGFWLFCGVLVFKKSWRFAYFRFLDNMKDKLCTLL